MFLEVVKNRADARGAWKAHDIRALGIAEVCAVSGFSAEDPRDFPVLEAADFRTSAVFPIAMSR